MLKNKILIDVIGLLSIALVAVVGYKLSPMLLPKADVTVQPDAACDLNRSPCSAVLPGGGKLTLVLSPRPIPMVKPFKVEVRFEGFAAERVEVDFSGVDMNMGLNRPVLANVGNGVFAGEGTLPVCVTGRMAWQATLLIETAKERIAVPFRFDSQDHE